MQSIRFSFLRATVALLIIAITLFAATQWAAAMLGYQPALGNTWLDIFGLKVYGPWKLFVWWLAFDTAAPDVFARAGAVAAFGGLASGAVAIGGTDWRASRNKNPTTYGSARWADFRDVWNAGLFDENGVVLGLYANRYLCHDSPEHVLVVAPTRSGKGVGLVVPTLLTWRGSVVVHDIKGENWSLTAGWRVKFSHCLLFDPSSPQSSRFNPLLEVRKGPGEVRDVQNIADILVDPDGSRERRDHWEKTAHTLLVGAILHVPYADEQKTLARVATFLADPARSIRRTLLIMLTTNHLGPEVDPKVHPVVASVARELLNKSENERSGVVSTAMSFLSLYRDPLIAATTASSDWRIADLIAGDRPVSLYLVPPSDISRTRPLVRLILNQIARRLTEVLPPPDQSVAPAAASHARRVPGTRSSRIFRIGAGAPGVSIPGTSVAFVAGHRRGGSCDRPEFRDSCRVLPQGNVWARQCGPQSSASGVCLRSPMGDGPCHRAVAPVTGYASARSAPNGHGRDTCSATRGPWLVRDIAAAIRGTTV
jgi:type IV secretion system protein VirD4